MNVSGSVLSNDWVVIPQVNISEVGNPGNTTRSDEYGKFSITVSGPNSQIRFDHAAYDYDTVAAGDFDGIMFLYPSSLDAVEIINDSKTKSDNTLWWVLGGVAAILVGRAVIHPAPKKVKI